MASAFWKTPFGRSDLPPVQAFDFGSDPWGSDAALWIKSETAASPSDCAVLAIERCGVEVWLYRNADGALLGFGAIAPSSWKIPAPNGPKVSISLIPWMGLHRDFWGKGLGAEKENKFSSLILDDLIDEVRRHTEVRELYRPVREHPPPSWDHRLPSERLCGIPARLRR